MTDPRNTVDGADNVVDWEEPDAEATGTFRAACVRNALGYQRPGQELERSGAYSTIAEQDFAAIEMRTLASLARSGDVGRGVADIPKELRVGKLYGRRTEEESE